MSTSWLAGIVSPAVYQYAALVASINRRAEREKLRSACDAWTREALGVIGGMREFLPVGYDVADTDALPLVQRALWCATMASALRGT